MTIKCSYIDADRSSDDLRLSSQLQMLTVGYCMCLGVGVGRHLKYEPGLSQCLMITVAHVTLMTLWITYAILDFVEICKGVDECVGVCSLHRDSKEFTGQHIAGSIETLQRRKDAMKTIYSRFIGHLGSKGVLEVSLG